MDPVTSSPATPAESTPVAAPAAPESAPASTPEVFDRESYTALVKSRLEANPPAEDGSRDEQGRFKAKDAGEPAEAPAEAPEKEPESEPAEETEEKAEAPADEPAEAAAPDRKGKLAELAKRVEAERVKRRAEAERKRSVEEFERHRPIVQGLQTDKIGTVDSLMTDAEFEALCDRRIARLNAGAQGQTPQAVAEQQQIRAEAEQAKKMAASAQGQLARMTFIQQAERVSAKAEGVDAARDWAAAQGEDFGELCAKVAEATHSLHGYWIPPEQARDAVIAHALTQLATAEEVSRKRSPATIATKSEKHTEEKRPKKTINSSLKGSSTKIPDIRVVDKESYAELVKARLRAGK